MMNNVASGQTQGNTLVPVTANSANEGLNKHLSDASLNANLNSIDFSRLVI